MAEKKDSWPFAPFIGERKFEAELIATARKVATPGKGILAADESTGTIGNRFQKFNLENNRANRRDYRQLLFTTPDLEKYISGAILFEETLFDKADDGKTDLVQFLRDKGIVLGAKVDLGTKVIPGTDKELYTVGLTDLDQRCQKYYKQGARFAKWRAVLEIGKNKPSAISIKETADSLARYASICQANGLVPVVEPEVLMDGDHDIETCAYYTEKVLAACYKSLSDYHVLLEGTLLKPNMVVSGQKCKRQASPAEVGAWTVKVLQRTVPPAVPGVTFLSGGQSEEEASLNLNAINAPGLGARPWNLSFSYGRALQQSCLKAWAGKKENTKAAQQAFMSRARANGEAALGKYKGDAASADSKKSLHVSGYTY
jgi:fructose-bisphosphate aldolase class I